MTTRAVLVPSHQVDRFRSMQGRGSPTQCWLWAGPTINGDGYARFWNGARHVMAHRAAFELAHGPIPEGMEIDHTCSVRNCVNPAHLEPVTHRENCLRTRARGRGSKFIPPLAFVHAARTHCPAGHPYAGDNLYRSPRGGRFCVACRRERDRIRCAARKAAA